MWKDDQRYSIVFNVNNIYLFAYFGMSLDLYHYLLSLFYHAVMNTFIQQRETISGAYLTDTPLCFPFIEPDTSLLPQGSLASIPSNALILISSCFTKVISDFIYGYYTKSYSLILFHKSRIRFCIPLLYKILVTSFILKPV